MVTSIPIQFKAHQNDKIDELNQLQEDFDNKKISLVEFEEKRMELDKEWLQ